MNDDDFLKKRLTFAVENYADAVFRAAYQYLLNRQDAEDVVQEVFLKFVQRLKNYDFADDEHVKAWLLRVAINEGINAAKYNSRRRSEGIENRSADSSDVSLDLSEELEKLSPEDREIIYLFYYEGYSAKEIAKFLGKRENAVHKRLSRAREKLKEFLVEDNL